MTTGRSLLGFALVLCVPACDAASEPRERLDASAPGDAGGEAPDAGADFDAARPDAAVARDAGGLDAFTAYDSGWGGCTYLGVMGTCMSVSECTTGRMPVMGLCPGPADIQCCLPAGDAGPPGTITPSDVLARLGACTRIGGDYATDVGETANIPVCQTDTVVWWTADMDIDCDGGRGAICMSDPDYLPDTSAVDSMGAPLDASTLPFIVLYGGRMVFGIFGDAGPAAIIGEASFAMAEALGIPSHPSTGGVDSGVTYLVFTGTAARVTRNEDHAEAVSFGEPLP